jgi:protein subunit release factor B
MAVSPEKQKALQEALLRLNIREEDVIERFIRSQGSGGQKVNKTSTAVYLKHLPTGLEVKMQKERSQALNRFLAWRLLAEKVEALQEGKSRLDPQAEKIRKQKNRRLRRAKKNSVLVSPEPS